MPEELFTIEDFGGSAQLPSSPVPMTKGAMPRPENFTDQRDYQKALRNWQMKNRSFAEKGITGLGYLGIFNQVQAAGAAEALGLDPKDEMGNSFVTTKKGDFTLWNEDFRGYRGFGDVFRGLIEKNFKEGKNVGKADSSLRKKRQEKGLLVQGFMSDSAPDEVKYSDEYLLQQANDQTKTREEKDFYNNLLQAAPDRRRQMVERLGGTLKNGEIGESKFNENSLMGAEAAGLVADFVLDPMTWAGFWIEKFGVKAGTHMLSNAGKSALAQTMAEKFVQNYGDDVAKGLIKTYGDDILEAGGKSISKSKLAEAIQKQTGGRLLDFAKPIDDAITSKAAREVWESSLDDIAKQIDAGEVAANNLDELADLGKKSSLKEPERLGLEVFTERTDDFLEQAKRAKLLKFGEGQYKIAGQTVDVAGEAGKSYNFLEKLQNIHSKIIREPAFRVKEGLRANRRISIIDPGEAPKVPYKYETEVNEWDLPELFPDAKAPEENLYKEFGGRPVSEQTQLVRKDRTLGPLNVTYSEGAGAYFNPANWGDYLDPASGLPTKEADDLYLKKMEVNRATQNALEETARKRDSLMDYKALSDKEIQEALADIKTKNPDVQIPKDVDKTSWEKLIKETYLDDVEKQLTKSQEDFAEWVQPYVARVETGGTRKSKILRWFELPDGTVKALPEQRFKDLPGYKMLKSNTDPVWILGDAEEALIRTGMFGRRQHNALEKALNLVTGRWKEMLVGYFPTVSFGKEAGKQFKVSLPVGFGFHTRNAQSNLYQMFLGGADVTRLNKNLSLAFDINEFLTKEGPEALDDIAKLKQYGLWDNAKNGVKGGAVRTGTGDIDIRTLIKKGFDTGVEQPDIMTRDLARSGSAIDLLMDEGNKQGWTVPGTKGNIKFENAGRDIGNQLEGSMRWAFFADQVRQGKTFEQAGKQVKTFLYDYGELSNVDKSIKTVVPFYIYLKNNLMMHGELLASGKAARYYPLAKALYYGDDRDRSGIPEYVKSGKKLSKDFVADLKLPYAGIPALPKVNEILKNKKRGIKSEWYNDAKDVIGAGVENFGVLGRIGANLLQGKPVINKYAFPNLFEENKNELSPEMATGDLVLRQLPFVGSPYVQAESLYRKSLKSKDDKEKQDYSFEDFQKDLVGSGRFLGMPFYGVDEGREARAKFYKDKSMMNYLKRHKEPPAPF